MKDGDELWRIFINSKTYNGALTGVGLAPVLSHKNKQP